MILSGGPSTFSTAVFGATMAAPVGLALGVAAGSGLETAIRLVAPLEEEKQETYYWGQALRAFFASATVTGVGFAIAATVGGALTLAAGVFLTATGVGVVLVLASGAVVARRYYTKREAQKAFLRDFVQLGVLPSEQPAFLANAKQVGLNQTAIEAHLRNLVFPIGPRAQLPSQKDIQDLQCWLAFLRLVEI